MKLEIFKTLSTLFSDNGFVLYIVGGTSRDYLLGKEFFDYDFVTNATPEEMKKFLLEADYTFAKFGSVKVKVCDTKCDVVTFRKEEDYKDYRHPTKISYVSSLEEDYVRRDFTINAIYIDKDLKIHDPSNGVKDLKNCTIRFIGNPETRIKEDPLRILRAERFAKKLNFKFEEKTQEAIIKYRYLLDKLNPDKIKEELKKAS